MRGTNTLLTLRTTGGAPLRVGMVDGGVGDRLRAAKPCLPPSISLGIGTDHLGATTPEVDTIPTFRHHSLLCGPLWPRGLVHRSPVHPDSHLAPLGNPRCPLRDDPPPSRVTRSTSPVLPPIAVSHWSRMAILFAASGLDASMGPTLAPLLKWTLYLGIRLPQLPKESVRPLGRLLYLFDCIFDRPGDRFCCIDYWLTHRLSHIVCDFLDGFDGIKFRD